MQLTSLLPSKIYSLCYASTISARNSPWDKNLNKTSSYQFSNSFAPLSMISNPNFMKVKNKNFHCHNLIDFRRENSKTPFVIWYNFKGYCVLHLLPSQKKKNLRSEKKNHQKQKESCCDQMQSQNLRQLMLIGFSLLRHKNEVRTYKNCFRLAACPSESPPTSPQQWTQ